MIRHRVIILLLFIPLVSAAFYFSLKTKIAVRTEDFSNPGLVSFQRMEELKKEYAFEDKLTLIVNKGSEFTTEDLCKIKTWFDEEAQNNNKILQTASLFDLRMPSYDGDKLFYPKIIKDPCRGEFDLESLKKHSLFPMLSNNDFTDLVLQIQLKPEDKALKHGIYDYNHLKKIIASAKATLPYEILPGGTLFFQSSVLDGISYSNFINILAVLLLIGLYYFFYRSLLFAFIMIVIILFANTFIKAGMTLSGHMIDPLSSCIFLMISVAILEDYILLSYMLFKQKLSFRRALKKLLLPSFLTSLTTAIGFGSLSVSDNPSIVHFSQWTAFGAMLEWFAIFIILPAFVICFPSLERRINNHARPRSVVPKELIRFKPRKGFTIFIAMIPFILFFIHDNANLNYSPLDMFTKTHEISNLRRHLVKTRKAEGEVSVLFHDEDVVLTPFIAKFKKHPMVSASYSEDDIITSIKESLPKVLHSMVIQDMRTTNLGKLFYSQHSRRIILSIKSYNSKDIPLLVKDLEDICQDKCELTSEIITSNDYAEGVLKTLYDSASTGFAAILLLVGWLVIASKKKHFIPILVSSLWASLALLLIFILFQIKINVVTCVALSILIGAAGDNSIQFLLFSKGSLLKSVSEIGEASSENFILMTALSSTLFFSYFATPRDLAWLLILGIVLMFIGDIWVLNGLTDESDKN